MIEYKLLYNYHVLWFDNDRRKTIYVENGKELDYIIKQKHKVDLQNGDSIYMKPIRVESYLDLKDMIKGDQKLWNKLNKKE